MNNSKKNHFIQTSTQNTLTLVNIYLQWNTDTLTAYEYSSLFVHILSILALYLLSFVFTFFSILFLQLFLFIVVENPFLLLVLYNIYNVEKSSTLISYSIGRQFNAIFVYIFLHSICSDADALCTICSLTPNIVFILNVICPL